LGLHPNVALKEGLFYGNTKILLTQYETTIRAILIIDWMIAMNMREQPKHGAGNYQAFHPSTLMKLTPHQEKQ
jgi:hypothetical protein